MASMVYLVGAGPGDPGLVTVKGLELIKKADCIIYDRLSSPELLGYAGMDCERIYVGKADRHHTLPQEQINELLVEKAKEYHCVVRLKGGDVFVFGRGGEEGLYLREHGISYTVVPGVTSAIAGPAYAGIPVTHRGVATSFRVITGHQKNGEDLSEPDFTTMSDSKETLIFLMGLSRVRQIVDGLMQAGRSRQTPAAVISHATTEAQEICEGTLENLADRVEEAKLTSPALIIVGDVVALRRQLHFFEEKPLWGKHYLVAKIGPKPSRLAAMLRAKGAYTSECMTGEIVGVPAVYTAQELAHVDVLLFTSANGVDYFMKNVFASGLDARALFHTRCAVIGQKTAEKLREYGICADFMPEHSNSTNLAQELKEYLDQEFRGDPFKRAGIRADIIDPKEALRLEPSANRDIIGAVRVPDGAVDPFRLTASNVMDAKLHGATILTYQEVIEIIREQNRVIGVKVLDHKTNEIKSYYATIVVNAGGIWGHNIAKLVDININMLPSKGALLIFGHRVNNIVLNRCRKPADADILVPGDTICLIGTTSSKVPFEEIDHMKVTPEEVDVLLREGEKMAPILAQTRILRAYAGVRPLVASDNDPSGRSVSRGIVLLDHATRDGLEGFITITGGKLMTYRLMAEWTTDLICKKLNLSAICTTATEKLPGSRESIEEISKKIISVPLTQRNSTIYRHGDMADRFSENTPLDNSLICECEEVSVGEAKYALNELDVNNLVDLRRRTRVGMGTCQGELCACRAAGLMSDMNKVCTNRAKADLASFLNERWKGMSPIAWGDTLRESEYTAWIYEGVCGLTSSSKK